MEWNLMIEMVIKPLLFLVFVGIILVFPKRIEALWQKNPIPENTILSTVIDYVFILTFGSLIIWQIINERKLDLNTGIFLLIFVGMIVYVIKSTFIKRFKRTESTSIYPIHYGYMNVKAEIDTFNQANDTMTIIMAASESPMSVKITYSDQLALKESLDRVRNNRDILPDLSDKPYQNKLIINGFLWVFAVIGVILIIII